MIKQEYTSASTSIKQIPAGFKIVDKYFGWTPNTVNLDIGGGKYDMMTNALKEKGVTNLVYDPFNRPLEHNLEILKNLEDHSVNTVTIFNVLNVIKEREVQLNCLEFAYDSLKYGGMLYVRSTYMNPKKVSGVTKSGSFQHYLTMNDYLLLVKEVFRNAVLKHGLIYSKL